MRVEWRREADVPVAAGDVFAYLADIPRHREWATTLESVTLLRAGTPSPGGVGARYRTTERVALGRGSWTLVTICEVRELVPQQRIVWTAHPRPRVGQAHLAFSVAALPDGGTRLTQEVREHYPPPLSWVLRGAINLTPETVERQLEATFQRLVAHLSAGVGTWRSDTPIA